jgi:hypothetical protein
MILILRVDHTHGANGDSGIRDNQPLTCTGGQARSKGCGDAGRHASGGQAVAVLVA